MLERPECTGPFLPLFLRAPRTPLGHHNQLAQGPREHCLIYMTIIFGWLQVRCARVAHAKRAQHVVLVSTLLSISATVPSLE